MRFIHFALLPETIFSKATAKNDSKKKPFLTEVSISIKKLKEVLICNQN